MDECQNCGAPVSDRFARVFGDNNDQLKTCKNCGTQADLNSGAGAIEGREARTHLGEQPP
ncbi:DUF7563 family protein [Halostella litorea]|uniref:DUF7563 family protein n=1 Tax=Halostella litorea TaxID=2528831 RepID=UPI001091BB0C|nr:hypothetical protein [Halostella litorea]